MDSKLDPVFRAAFRHAEPVDTRQAIRREDPADHHRRPPRGKDERAATAEGEDVTVVSVPALLAFLQNLLAEAGQVVPVPPPDTPSQHPTPPRPADPLAARAAGAYSATARHAAPPPPPTPPPTVPSGHGTALSDAELHAIHKLIGDVQILAARQVDHLRIEKNGSFLASLQEAARKALAGS